MKAQQILYAPLILSFFQFLEANGLADTGGIPLC